MVNQHPFAQYQLRYHMSPKKGCFDQLCAILNPYSYVISFRHVEELAHVDVLEAVLLTVHAVLDKYWTICIRVLVPNVHLHGKYAEAFEITDYAGQHDSGVNEVGSCVRDLDGSSLAVVRRTAVFVPFQVVHTLRTFERYRLCRMTGKEENTLCQIRQFYASVSLVQLPTCL